MLNLPWWYYGIALFHKARSKNRWTKATFVVERLRVRRTEPYTWALYWKLEHFIGFTMLRWHLDGTHVDALWQTLDEFWQVVVQNSYLPHHEYVKKLRFCVVGPSQWTFKHILACHQFSFVITIPPSYYTLGLATLHYWELKDLHKGGVGTISF